MSKAYCKHTTGWEWCRTFLLSFGPTYSSLFRIRLSLNFSLFIFFEDKLPTGWCCAAKWATVWPYGPDLRWCTFVCATVCICAPDTIYNLPATCFQDCSHSVTNLPSIYESHTFYCVLFICNSLKNANILANLCTFLFPMCLFLYKNINLET